MGKLDEARIVIDEVDSEIAKLFERRMKAVEDVIAYKIENNLPVFDEKREQIVIEKNVARIQNEVYKPYFEEYLHASMEISKKYQRTFVEKKKVAYQGVEGAFSHIASSTLFPYEELTSYQTFQQVFEAVEKGEMEYGIIPLENSYTGEVGDVFDLLYSYKNIYIVETLDLAVSQNLLGIKGSKLSDITSVYSHPQALSQCSLFLEGLQAKTVSYPNTALAAKYVSEQNNVSMAAIASKKTATEYGLDILVNDINNSKDNTTRFIVIKNKMSYNGHYFSILFSVEHEAGALAKVIDVIRKYGYNMESIHSRSTKHQSWQYYFYIEMSGSHESEKTRELLEELGNSTQVLRVLGWYDRKED